MPKSFIAHDGEHPEFATLYNISEHTSPKYPPRTACNVRDSDATVRFASNFDSPGEKLTLKMVQKYKKPHYDVNILDPPSISKFAEWISTNNIKVLNVAGNSEKTNKGIEKFVISYFKEYVEYIQ